MVVVLHVSCGNKNRGIDTVDGAMAGIRQLGGSSRRKVKMQCESKVAFSKITDDEPITCKMPQRVTINFRFPG